MVVLREGRLQIQLPRGVQGWKFDDHRTHGLSTMKAVDFIIEQNKSFWFVELKDPSIPSAPPDRPEEYKADLMENRLGAC